MTRRRKPAEDKRRESAATSAADRYREMLQEVAEDLGFDADSDAAEHVAVLRLMRKAILARLLHSDVLRTDPDDLLKLDAALKAYMPASKGPQFQLSIVHGEVECPDCHFTFNPVTNKPVQPSFRFNARCTECGKLHAYSSEPLEGGRLVSETAPQPVSEPEPAVQYRNDVASSFHAQVIGKEQIVSPLARDQARVGASYTGNTVRDLWRNDPNPTRNGAVAHRLPAVINGKG